MFIVITLTLNSNNGGGQCAKTAAAQIGEYTHSSYATRQEKVEQSKNKKAAEATKSSAKCQQWVKEDDSSDVLSPSLPFHSLLNSLKLSVSSDALCLS